MLDQMLFAHSLSEQFVLGKLLDHTQRALHTPND